MDQETRDFRFTKRSRCMWSLHTYQKCWRDTNSSIFCIIFHEFNFLKGQIFTKLVTVTICTTARAVGCSSAAPGVAGCRLTALKLYYYFPNFRIEPEVMHHVCKGLITFQLFLLRANTTLQQGGLYDFTPFFFLFQFTNLCQILNLIFFFLVYI